MISKYVLCFAVLVAAIEARPQYVAISIAEYEALINGQAESQSHSYRLASDTPHIRHKRSNDQFTPIVSPQQQPYRPHRRQQVAPSPSYNFEPQYITQQYEPSVTREVFVEPEYAAVSNYNRGYKQPFRPQQQRPQQYAASVINEVAVEPEYAPVRRYNGGYKQQNRQQQYAASVANEVAAESERIPAVQQYKPRPRPQEPENFSPLRPFTGGYQGTPQQHSPNQIIYVEDHPHGEFSQADQDPGASATHEKRDSGYGSSGDDHVDYGAYTGSHGAFGWYSDHPVLIHR